MSHKIFRLVSSLFLALAVLGSGLNIQPVRAAGPWYVAPTGDDNNDCLSPGTACATINGAIGKASAGDTINVAIGAYTGTGNEVVLLNKDATLSGGWDASFTTQSGMSTIDGQGAHRGMTVNGSVTANIERFVVQNGYTSNADGGGIFNGGVLTLSNSFVASNMATSVSVSSGGGIFNQSASNLTLNNTTISGNTASYGGGIFNDGGILTLNSSKVLNNTVSSSGGGIANWSGVMIMNSSTVSGNTFIGSTAGGIFAYTGTVTINNSTINDNNALSTNNGNGGGIELVADNLILNNSTITGNESHLCSGISNQTGAITINNGTIADNNAVGGSGAVCNTYVGTVTLQNTILARNTTVGMGADCTGTINSSGYNLIGDTSNCTFTAATGDLTNVDPLLGPLQNNGGPTFTHALLPGSPAIDAGDNATCLATDQRGVARPQGGRCDIGAFELETTGGGGEEVTIDIKPGSQSNPINPKSIGKIPVAILSTADFDAPSEVDKTSLTFGRTGDELSLVSCNKKGEDVNGDGLLDLVCQFKTKLTGFKFGDTEGILKGQTLEGVSIEGRDLVRILK